MQAPLRPRQGKPEMLMVVMVEMAVMMVVVVVMMVMTSLFSPDQ